MKYSVLVNGEPRAVDVPERMPLLWVLRDSLDLKGTKFGCGAAQCGACTVLLDGQPIRSCITPISAVGKAAVTTIESLPRDGSHPLQRAWLDLDVPQCGYCQAGQLMAASALLKATPNPTDAQIDAAMSGNVCRCGTYMRIKQAIKSAAGAGGGPSHGDNPEGSGPRSAGVPADLGGGRRRTAHRPLYATRRRAGAPGWPRRVRGVACAEHLHHGAPRQHVHPHREEPGDRAGHQDRAAAGHRRRVRRGLGAGQDPAGRPRPEVRRAVRGAAARFPRTTRTCGWWARAAGS